MRYYFKVIDWFGSEHRGAFNIEEGRDSIEIAKEIALERVKKNLRNRLGPKFEPKRVRQIIVANHMGLYNGEC